MSLYQYVGSNPFNISDPSGNGFVDCCKALADLQLATLNLAGRTAQYASWPDAGHTQALVEAANRVANELERVMKHCGGRAGVAAAITAAQNALKGAKSAIEAAKMVNEAAEIFAGEYWKGLKKDRVAQALIVTGGVGLVVAGAPVIAAVIVANIPRIAQVAPALLAAP